MLIRGDNFDQPVALLMVMTVHWVPDEADPHGLIAQYRDHELNAHVYAGVGRKP